MKLTNSTDYPNHFLRRMVAWCCREIGLPPKTIRDAKFGNKSSAWGGRGGVHRIYVGIGPDSAFPVEAFHYPGRTDDAFLGPRIEDRLEALVAVTAHELTHCQEHQHLNSLPMIRRLRRGWNSERKTMHNERQVLGAFRRQRETLLAEWSLATPKHAKEKPSIQEQRAAKVEKALANWQRKLKLAQTKVKQYRRKARYYEGAIAAKSGQ
jgi:hypothetical protein